MLHNNSSTLESTNSFIRGSKKDTSLLVEKGLISENLVHGARKITSKSYSEEDSTEENKNLYKSDYDITKGSKQRQKWLDGREQLYRDLITFKRVCMLNENLDLRLALHDSLAGLLKDVKRHAKVVKERDYNK